MLYNILHRFLHVLHKCIHKFLHTQKSIYSICNLKFSEIAPEIAPEIAFETAVGKAFFGSKDRKQELISLSKIIFILLHFGAREHFHHKKRLSYFCCINIRENAVELFFHLEERSFLYKTIGETAVGLESVLQNAKVNFFTLRSSG